MEVPDIFQCGETVTLPQVLDARELRVYRQQDLTGKYGKPLLCFTMNIAGPIKNSTWIRRAFRIGVEDFRLQLVRTKTPLLFEAVLDDAVTGCEAYFVADTDAISLKRLACELEDHDALGRLYDMDVLYADGKTGEVLKVDRQAVGGGERRCLVCGAAGRDCAARRLHTVAELQQKTGEIIYRAVAEREASQIAEYAVRALLYEVSVTPKPGLVDRNNGGSHRDMDFYTFLNSAASLWPYFENCARIGLETAEKPAGETFAELRGIGKTAENRMLAATGGVNTHKGAIFTMGIVTAAAGRVSFRQEKDLYPAETVLNECAAMTAGLTERDFARVTKENARTAGEHLYAEYGITGIRGQMEAGLPAVRRYGLPLLRTLLQSGKSEDEAGGAVLLELLAHTTDTNMIHRGSVDCQREEAEKALALLESMPDRCPAAEQLRELDEDYISRNLSPGGSADLLAVCWFLHILEQRGEEKHV